MTLDERHAHYRRLIDGHNTALRAFREASNAFDAAMEGVTDLMRSIRHANDAQGHAIEAMLAANREALALLNEDRA